MKKSHIQIGRLSRRKGHSFEREIAKIFREKTAFSGARRHLEYQGQEAAAGVDIIEVGKLAPQCKRGRSYAPITKLFEVGRVKNNIPMLITKADDSPILVALYFEDFIRIIKDIGEVYDEDDFLK